LRHQRSGESIGLLVERAQREKINLLESISGSERKDMTAEELERTIEVLSKRLAELKRETGQEEVYTTNEEDLKDQKEMERLAREEIDKIKSNRKREELMVKQDSSPEATLLRRQDEAKRQEMIGRLEKSYGVEKARRMVSGIERANAYGYNSLEMAYRKSLKEYFPR